MSTTHSDEHLNVFSQDSALSPLDLPSAISPSRYSPSTFAEQDAWFPGHGVASILPSPHYSLAVIAEQRNTTAAAQYLVPAASCLSTSRHTYPSIAQTHRSAISPSSSHTVTTNSWSPMTSCTPNPRVGSLDTSGTRQRMRTANACEWCRKMKRKTRRGKRGLDGKHRRPDIIAPLSSGRSGSRSSDGMSVGSSVCSSPGGGLVSLTPSQPPSPARSSQSPASAPPPHPIPARLAHSFYGGNFSEPAYWASMQPSAHPVFSSVYSPAFQGQLYPGSHMHRFAPELGVLQHAIPHAPSPLSNLPPPTMATGPWPLASIEGALNNQSSIFAHSYP
ncbi:uncharacterized protein BXZ73DRAFT_81990 [Epithele typhae]|uniref:uncharacterized protein n=1 Tax=Epithele typhae TaxID=378194 RepID=UPI00200889D3|nr:uncharacterized protein BXZ73DRAFT_81990 [Epithele typhae]KAH9913139.1 hypothetical protein BXZ73DRAFT_81990 [Epithele typhae]